MSAPRKLQLLAPARDAATAMAAIAHGADAVYIGAPAFGARAQATNSLDDIAAVVQAAHPYGVQVYVTVNTIIYEHELPRVQSLVWELYRLGVDALIVQDMALLEMHLPPIQLHASTQTDARTIDKIEALAQNGFSQIVLPREFNLDQISRASRAAAAQGASTEVFVHGALCVSYSGDCQAGQVLARRSANRGECPQICRLKFTLTDGTGQPVTPPDGGSAHRHWLSLADMCRLDYLQELADAGVYSFKIEGRLKSIDYVKNVTAAYSAALDKIVASSEGRYVRSSYGRVNLNFRPDVTRSFNRGFTPFFITGNNQNGSISSWASPKWIGKPIGKVKRVNGNRLELALLPGVVLANGDGAGYFDAAGAYTGFRINRADGATIYPAPDAKVPVAGTQLYRNNDSTWTKSLERTDTARRTIDLDIKLCSLPDGRLAVTAGDSRGCHATVCSDAIYTETARNDQAETHRRVFEKLGDTVYKLKQLEDCAAMAFIPSKDLTALRRQAIGALDAAWQAAYPYPRRKPVSLNAAPLITAPATYHDNIANSLAMQYYKRMAPGRHQQALEVTMPADSQLRVMTTRYCLRRALGCCLKGKDADKLPKDLYLTGSAGRLSLRFDCPNCQMHIYTQNTNTL